MPPRQQIMVPAPQPWFQPSDLIRIGIPIAALAAGFYFTTNARLSESDKSFDAISKRFDTISASIEIVKNKTSEVGKVDQEARTRVRDEFIKAQSDTNQALAKLDTKAAVAETRFEQMVTTLNKINDQMAVIAGSAARSSAVMSGGRSR
jgi:hypothetical protein